MDLTQLTPTELRKMTKEAIIQAVLEGQTYSQTIIERDEDGNQLRQVDETFDAYTGNLIGRREIEWTYYEPGVVDEITVTEKAVDGKVIDAYAVKHYADRQPKVIKQLGGRDGRAASGQE